MVTFPSNSLFPINLAASNSASPAASVTASVSNSATHSNLDAARREVAGEQGERDLQQLIINLSNRITSSNAQAANQNRASIDTENRKFQAVFQELFLSQLEQPFLDRLSERLKIIWINCLTESGLFTEAKEVIASWGLRHCQPIDLAVLEKWKNDFAKQGPLSEENFLNFMTDLAVVRPQFSTFLTHVATTQRSERSAQTNQSKSIKITRDSLVAKLNNRAIFNYEIASHLLEVNKQLSRQDFMQFGLNCLILPKSRQLNLSALDTDNTASLQTQFNICCLYQLAKELLPYFVDLPQEQLLILSQLPNQFRDKKQFLYFNELLELSNFDVLARSISTTSMASRAQSITIRAGLQLIFEDYLNQLLVFVQAKYNLLCLDKSSVFKPMAMFKFLNIPLLSLLISDTLTSQLSFAISLYGLRLYTDQFNAQLVKNVKSAEALAHYEEILKNVLQAESINFNTPILKLKYRNQIINYRPIESLCQLLSRKLETPTYFTLTNIKNQFNLVKNFLQPGPWVEFKMRSYIHLWHKLERDHSNFIEINNWLYEQLYDLVVDIQNIHTKSANTADTIELFFKTAHAYAYSDCCPRRSSWADSLNLDRLVRPQEKISSEWQTCIRKIKMIGF